MAGSPSVPEFRIVCAAAEAAGVEALHGTLDELAYDGSLLRVHDEPVHLVYRRALLEDLPEGDLSGRGPRPPRPWSTRSARAWPTTRSSSRCSATRFAHLVRSRERPGRSGHHPLDAGARPGRASYGDWVVDLLQFVSDNRERLVLKPASDYGGHGVALGMETGQATGTG